MSGTVRFDFMHFMPYVHLPKNQKDYKSLAQSAGGLQLLAELLKARSDDAAWQAASGNVVAAATAVQAAAREEDAGKCKLTLENLEKAASAAAAIKPTGPAQSLSRAPAIRPLMLTMDAIQADAKIALLTGNVEAAKKQAHVLAELARLVSNSRTTEQWHSLAGDFVSAATAAAPTKPSVPPASSPSGAAKPAAQTGAYGVQLGAFKSGADAANKRWAHLNKEYPKILAGLSPTVSPLKSSSGTLYRLQATGLTEKHASSVCKSLKAKSQGCILLHPTHH
jgi:cell division protein FtsN